MSGKCHQKKRVILEILIFVVEHYPVMVEKVCMLLVKNTKGIYLDATVGGGGHSEALLKKFPNITIYAADWDINAIERSRERLKKFNERVKIFQSAFSDIEHSLKKYSSPIFDGILTDFGTSIFQLKEGDGFSFYTDTPLDMRMSKTHKKITAYSIVNYADAKELVYILRTYGDEYHAKKIVAAIIRERERKKIGSTMHLASIISHAIFSHKTTIHPATKTFQALRIAVNNEYKEIDSFLKQIPRLINIGGIFIAISFHSGEDFLIKNWGKKMKNEFRDIVDGIIVPDENEIEKNNASRSAKMRVFEKMIDSGSVIK